MRRFYALIEGRRIELMDWQGDVFGGLRVASIEASNRGLDGALIRVEDL